MRRYGEEAELPEGDELSFSDDSGFEGLLFLRDRKQFSKPKAPAVSITLVMTEALTVPGYVGFLCVWLNATKVLIY